MNKVAIDLMNNIIDKMSEGVSIKEYREYFKIINKAYRDKEIENDKLEIKEEKIALTYLIYRMPATSQVIDYVLSQLKIFDENDIKTVLDLGSGPGASIIPLMDNFPSLENITLIEEQSSMINIGREFIKILKDRGFNIDDGTNKLGSNHTDIKYVKRSVNSLKSVDNDGKLVDLILSSYMINEFTQKEVDEFFRLIKESKFKYFISIVPGTPHHFKILDYLRKNFLKNDYFEIIAPCTFTGICNLEEDWCHFAKRVNRSSTLRSIKEGELSYEDEKFSYLIIKNKLYTEDSKCEDKKRIIRHPEIRKGLIKFKTCSREGIGEIVLTKGKDKEKYKASKDLGWGDMIWLDKSSRL